MKRRQESKTFTNSKFKNNNNTNDDSKKTMDQQNDSDFSGTQNKDGTLKIPNVDSGKVHDDKTRDATPKLANQDNSEVHDKNAGNKIPGFQGIPGSHNKYDPNPRINAAVMSMMQHGHTNENGWLTQLLIDVDGDIPKALAIIENNKKNAQHVIVVEEQQEQVIIDTSSTNPFLNGTIAVDPEFTFFTDDEDEFEDAFEELSDDSGMSDTSDQTIINTWEDTEQGHYIPNIVSIDKMPSWNEVMQQRDESQEETFSKLTEVIASGVGHTWFAPIFKSETTLFISTLTSCLLSTGTAVASLFNDISFGMKALHTATIVSNLITFTLSIGHLFMQRKINFNTEKLVTQIPELALTFNTENKANSVEWIYTALTTVITLVVAGLTAFNVCDVKSVIEKGMLLRSTEHMSSLAKNVTKFLLEDLLHLDITGDQAAFNDLHMWAKRTSELCTLPYLDYLKNTSLMLELNDAVTKTLPIITKKYESKTLSIVSRSAYSLILNNTQKLLDKLSAIKIILGAVKRQETLGVLFAGEASVGKSSLSVYCARKIAEKLGYDPKLYNLNMSRKDGFYGPYGGQDFGVIDEFMALRGDDPNLPQLNQILSGDHFNFEAAHLEGKNQPSALKCVFLTSNNLCPNITKVLDVAAAQATWDRILRFEVIDPLIQGRQGSNTHRRPDFSHLRFRFVTNTRELTPTNLVFEEVTIDEVLGMMMFQMAKRELNYIQQEALLNAVEVEKDRLKKRADFLQSIQNTNAANCGEMFNVIRLQGPFRTGKTRIARLIAQNITRAYVGWQRINVTNFDTPPIERGIYLIDDCLTPSREDYEKYLKWINQGTPNNLYIIITNHTFERQRSINNKIKNWWSGLDSFYWKVNLYGASSGVARRLGLNGTIYTEKNEMALITSGSVTIDVPTMGEYIVNGVPTPELELLQLTYNNFQRQIAGNNDVVRVNEVFVGSKLDMDATVICESFECLKDVFSSQAKTIAACFRKTGGVSITFKKDLMSIAIRSFEDTSQLLPRGLTGVDDLETNALRIATILNDVKPGVNCRLYIEDSKRELILFDRRLYVGTKLPINIDISYDPLTMQITYKYAGYTTTFNFEQYNYFCASGGAGTNLEKIPPEVAEIVHTWINDNIGDTNPMFNFHKYNAELLKLKKSYAEKSLIDFIKDHKALTVVTGLVGIVSLTGIVTLAAKLFMPKKEEPNIVSSNAKGGRGGGKASDEEYVDQNIKDHVARYRRAVLTGSSSEAKLIRDEAYAAGHREAWNRWEHEFRSNAQNISEEYARAIANNDIDRLEFLIHAFRSELKEALVVSKSNNLTIAEQSHQRTTDIERMLERFRKNSVLVTSRGKVYGVGLCGRMFITVSHIFNDIDSPVVVQSDGNQYSARVIRLSRQRDLAVCIITDMKFPQFQDIRNMLLTEEEFHLVSNAYYLRPLEKSLAYSANVKFIPNIASPKTDKNNPLFSLESQFWMFSLIGIDDPNRVFQSGDCGLPLITFMNNEAKFIGIHNAIHISGYSWFASIAIDDIESIKANSMCDTVVHTIAKQHMVIDTKSKSALMEPITDSLYQGVSPLKVFGYSKALHYRSNPKFKKVYAPIVEEIFGECPKVPAALDLTHVKDTSALYADKKGRFNPLFSQAVKYAEKLETLNQFDPEIDNYVSDIIKTYYQCQYGPNRQLPLHEVINGFGKLKGIEMHTSAGPKLKKWFKVHTKIPANDPEVLFKDLNKGTKPFYIINTESSAGKELINDYRMYLGSIYQGIAPLIISKDNPKVELIAREKVEKGKVRLFNELDLSINMVLKTFFGSFLEHVIAKHETEIFCIGTNPFIDATAHMFYFNAIEGEYLNADFKALDKSTPAHLIRDFVYCALQHEEENVKKSLSDMLTYRLHTMDGHLYFTDCGNCSGSYVTTLMNCHTVLKVSLYTFCRKWRETYGSFPSYNEIMKNSVIRILGDDAIRKFSNLLTVTNEDLKTDAALYGLTQTPAKTDGLVAFCSRSYEEIAPMIYFPKLAKESIISQLFWYNNWTADQVQMNIMTALLEATLHGEIFFNECKRAAIKVTTHFRVPFDYIPYKQARDLFIDYIRGAETSPVFKEQANLLSQKNNTSNSSELQISFLKMADSWLNEYVQKRSLQPATFEFRSSGPDNDLEWHCEATLKNGADSYIGRGSSTRKADAKRLACADVKRLLNGQPIGRVTVDGENVKDLDQELIALIEKLAASGKKNITIQLSDNATSNCDLHAQVEKDQATSNADMPIEPATINQAATAMSTGTLPSATNPQPTGVIPAMTSAGEDIMANLQFAEHQVLQPVGAPNMLAVGAVTFDIKNLVYEQFLDADIELEVTDDLTSGAVLLQIPYGINHQWVNPYIKSYARLHKRYAGAVQYRFTVIGNPLFSGAVGIAWLPRANPGNTILVSEAQKFAYSAKGVTMPWNVIHTLHDGRQELFYRHTDEVIDAERPHLIMFLMMSLQNPLREGVKTRIRIASKLCNSADPNPFVLSEPVIALQLAEQVNDVNALSPMAFDDVFINARNVKINIYSDGTTASQQDFLPGQYVEYNPRAFNMASARRIVGLDDNITTSTSNVYGPNQPVTQHWSDYVERWPRFAQLIQQLSLGDLTNGRGIVGVCVNHNMDYLSYSTLMKANPWGGWGIPTALFTQANWELARTSGAWHMGTLQNSSGGVKILSAVYNDTYYNLKTTVHGGKPEFLMMGGYIKIITNKGTAIFFLTSFVTNTGIASPRPMVEVIQRFSLTAQTTLENGDTIPSYPFLNIDEQVAFTAPVDSLPLGFEALRITDIPASAVLISGYPGATASDNATIERWFHARAGGLPTTQCLQFRLVDSVSVRTIATVRYIQELRQFVINTVATSAYRLLPILTSNIQIQSIITTDRTNDFAITDTSLWYERSAASFLKNAKFETVVGESEATRATIFEAIKHDEAKSNAWLGALASVAGGGMSGIGAGLSAIGQRRHEKDLQKNQFSHDEMMQGNMFNFQNQYQDKSFDFQKMMRQGDYAQEQLMQERGYQNDLGLLQSSHMEQRITNKEQSQNRMAERGLSTRIQFLKPPEESYV